MEALIEQCTSEKNTQDKWDLIIRVCEDYASKEPKACIKVICKRIFHKNPNISIRAITLLDACSKNAGKPFNRELASRDFTQMVKSRLTSLQRIPCLKFIEVMERWADDFKKDSELSLLTSLFSWTKTEHASLVLQMQEEKQTSRSARPQQAVANLQAREEEELAQAIALSLRDTSGGKYREPEQHRTTTSSSGRGGMNQTTGNASQRAGPYPELAHNVLSNVPPAATATGKGVPVPTKGRVRALYDFEAAEDNELTFKTGELVVLLDDSDENWWRGSNHRGEGFFPAQFVKREDESEPPQPQSSSCNDGVTEVAPSVQKPLVPTLDAQKLESCLQLINSVDPTGEFRADPPELAQLEAECYAMSPLMDPELEKVDKRVMMLTELNQRLLDAFQQYHDLMSRAPPLTTYFNGPGMYMINTGPAYASPLTQPVMCPAQPMRIAQVDASISQPVGPTDRAQVVSMTAYPGAVCQSSAVPQQTTLYSPTIGSQGIPPVSSTAAPPNYYGSSVPTTSPQHHFSQQPPPSMIHPGNPYIMNPNGYPTGVMMDVPYQGEPAYVDPNQPAPTGYYPPGYFTNSNVTPTEGDYSGKSAVVRPSEPTS